MTMNVAGDVEAIRVEAIAFLKVAPVVVRPPGRGESPERRGGGVRSSRAIDMRMAHPGHPSAGGQKRTSPVKRSVKRLAGRKTMNQTMRVFVAHFEGVLADHLADFAVAGGCEFLELEMTTRQWEDIHT